MPQNSLYPVECPPTRNTSSMPRNRPLMPTFPLTSGRAAVYECQAPPQRPATMPGQASPDPQDEAPPRKELLWAFYRAVREGRIEESDVERIAEARGWADWPSEIRSKLGYSHRPRPRPQAPEPAPGIPNPMAMASAIMLATREGKLTDQDRRTMDAKHPEDWPREIWEKLGFEPPVPKSSPAVPAGPTGGTPVEGPPRERDKAG